MTYKFTLTADAPQYTFIQYNRRHSQEYDIDFSNSNDVWFTINHDQTVLANPLYSSQKPNQETQLPKDQAISQIESKKNQKRINMVRTVQSRSKQLDKKVQNPQKIIIKRATTTKLFSKQRIQSQQVQSKKNQKYITKIGSCLSKQLKRRSVSLTHMSMKQKCKIDKQDIKCQSLNISKKPRIGSTFHHSIQNFSKIGLMNSNNNQNRNTQNLKKVLPVQKKWK